ncbi:MAG: hypothetical protein ACI90R_001555, partial [Alteromonas macleodii]
PLGRTNIYAEAIRASSEKTLILQATFCRGRH